MNQTLREIENDSKSAYFYSNSAQNILGGLKGALALIERKSLALDTPANGTNHDKSNRVFIVHGRIRTIGCMPF